MSNIGRKIIRIPENIKIAIQKNDIILSNNTAILKIKKPSVFIVNYKENRLWVNVSQKNMNIKDQKNIYMFWGTFRSYLNNAILGLNQPFQISLKIVGVSYRMYVENNDLCLKIGFSHPVSLKIPTHISVTETSSNKVTMRSSNKTSLLQFAALVRSYKVPEPYKGKGIVYKGEYIRRKEGKKK